MTYTRRYRWRCVLVGVGLLAWVALAIAELPCVSPADAVLALNSPQSGILTSSGVQAGPSSGNPYPSMQITCPPGKRVGLWIASPEPVLLSPMQITGCEVGVVVGADTRYQVVEGFLIRGARVGVCWQADKGLLATTDIQATEYAVVSSGDDFLMKGNHFRIPGAADSHLPRHIYGQESVACTCPGDV